MKKRKLKGFVLPTAYVIGVTFLFLGIMYVGSKGVDSTLGNYKFVTGLFNENLGRTEDNEMHYRIRKAGYKICFNPDIIS